MMPRVARMPSRRPEPQRREPSQKAARQPGFSLIEILVVLFIVGIGVTLAAISLSTGARPYEIKAAARQFYGVTSLALEEAILTGEQLGLRFDVRYSDSTHEPQYRYSWLVYDREEELWKELEEHDVLVATEFPQHILLDVEVEGQPVIIGGKKEKQPSIFALTDEEKQGLDIVTFDDTDKEKRSQELLPDLYFLSSGEVLDFRVTIADQVLIDDAAENVPYYRIRGDSSGKITLIRPGEEDNAD